MPLAIELECLGSSAQTSTESSDGFWVVHLLGGEFLRVLILCQQLPLLQDGQEKVMAIMLSIS